MLDRFTGMQVFSRVAGLGNLSAAARSLSMSQTMATKHVAAIEERLGTKLLHRTTRRMTLTEAGRNYLTAITGILSDIEAAEASISDLTMEPQGTLRLNTSISLGIRVIAPLLPQLREQCPNLVLDMGLNDRYVDPIEEGWDLMIRIGSLEDSTMIARRLASCPRIVCASPDYIDRYGCPQSVEELKGHTCLGYTLSKSVGVNSWSFGNKGQKRVVINRSFGANNSELLVSMAVMGQGIVYQPYFLVARELEAGLLTEINLDYQTIDVGGIYAVYPSDRNPPAKIRVAVDYFARHVGYITESEPEKRGSSI